MTKTVVWRKARVWVGDVEILCSHLVALGMDFNVSLEKESDGRHFTIEVSFDLPETPKEVVCSQPGFMYDFKRREDGYMETSYPLCGDFKYFVELNGKVVEWGHTFQSAREARCRLIGDVKVLAKKRSEE